MHNCLILKSANTIGLNYEQKQVPYLGICHRCIWAWNETKIRGYVLLYINNDASKFLRPAHHTYSSTAMVLCALHFVHDRAPYEKKNEKHLLKSLK